MLKSLKKILPADPKNFYSLQFTHQRHTDTQTHTHTDKIKRISPLT